MGASKGLGRAITQELLVKTQADILAVSRSAVPSAVRLQTVQADIAEAASIAIIADAIRNLPNPLVVILNAAAVVTDLQGSTLAFDVFHRINAVQISGLGHVLEAVLPRLLSTGGAFVAISSFSAYNPPVREPRIAYPASKAYLDMAMRALSLQWGGRIAFTTVHLGNMAEHATGSVLRPSYQAVAEGLVARFAAGNFPREINITWPYLVAYKYCFSWLSDRAYAWLLRRSIG